MREEVICAGFGGQGIVFIGEWLARAAMEDGRYVTLTTSYGPETRGGTVNCMVTISDEEIASPLIENPDSLLVMNLPSLERFESSIKSGGLLILNRSLIDCGPQKSDIVVLAVNANEEAKAINHPMLANVIMLGAYLKTKNILHEASVLKALAALLSKKSRQSFIEMNKIALQKGAECALQKSPADG